MRKKGSWLTDSELNLYSVVALVTVTSFTFSLSKYGGASGIVIFSFYLPFILLLVGFLYAFVSVMKDICCKNQLNNAGKINLLLIRTPKTIMLRKSKRKSISHNSQ